LGYRAIRSSEVDIVIASGSENMGNTCHLIEAKDLRWGNNRLGNVPIKDILFELGYSKNGFNAVALDAGEAAVEYGISREDQDQWALQSHQRWARAYNKGKYNVGEEIMSIEIPMEKGGPLVFEKDESPRETNMDKLAKLKPVYGSPTVTPGNAPGLNSGAAAMVIMSRKKMLEKGLKPLGSIEAVDWAAGDPKYMAALPAKAIKKVLLRLGKSIEEMDLIEINEAFAAVPLVSLKILAGMDNMKMSELRKKTNVNGGAIAIGHPVGASGARITMTLMYELARRGGGWGVASICGGLGQGESIVLNV
jgi:acetyl-CoA C-acetyltransferase